jgi:16S rRNA (adenine1518-N6/adenine1519-N6)-dimethyltransferase
MVAAAEVTHTDRVLEVGPGLGPLTELLVQHAGHVTAIETDLRLVEILRPRFATASNLTLIHADALEYLRTEPTDWSAWKLVANLPFSVASPLLVELTQSMRGPRRLVFTVQMEVAHRLVAGVGDDDYGLLSLLVQLHYTSLGGFKIPATCFFPVPKIDSACLTLARREPSLAEPDVAARFTRLVKRGFGQRRKMLVKLLKDEWPVAALTAALERLQLRADVRAEQVSLEQFVRLAQMLHSTKPAFHEPEAVERGRLARFGLAQTEGVGGSRITPELPGVQSGQDGRAPVHGP